MKRRTRSGLEARSQGVPEGPEPSHEGLPAGRYLALLGVAALGVVYGDIGTSPLYAIRECFHGPKALPATPGNVMGVLSLVFWSLVLVICVKYLIFVLRADNRGEGGILALMALARPPGARPKGLGRALLLLGLFGAALLYGDGMITPAISVLSAVEGLRIATPAFERFVEPVTVVILIGLFLVQRRGTAKVGTIFGPVMLLWFVTIAVLGLREVVREPGVLAAVNPAHAVAFFLDNGWHGFLALGTVFLVVTGGEALYADMGHFGARPIRLVWFALVLPCLLANYFGQGALLLSDPGSAENPFYGLAPPWALYPLVGIATAAAVIASQAVISGAFSLTRQAVQLGFSPRLLIEHTSERQLGQIYVPAVNMVLMLATIGLVLGFHSSSNLAAAYGVAVTATMAITTVLLVLVARERWGWSRAGAGLLALFLVPDLAFFGASALKIPHGGWFPLVVAAGVLTLMTTWRTGRRLLNERLRRETTPLERFLAEETEKLVRVPGTAVYLTRTAEGVPPALLHNLKHNHVLHERVVLLTILTEAMPHVHERDRIEAERLGSGFYRVVLHYGFMEDPVIPAALARVESPGLEISLPDTTYFLGKETIFATRRPGMALWRERLFAFMARNARSATLFFGLPPGRVVEMGAQIEM
ncbi:MAG: potassium transporter Kup [Thermoanaerobaculia bacterium]